MKGAKVRRVTFYQTVNPAYPESHSVRYDSKMECDGIWGRKHTRKRIEYVVPATPEAMEQLVEKVAEALFANTYQNGKTLKDFQETFPATVESYRTQARAALSAVFGKGGR
jgi:hypothetical protein